MSDRINSSWPKLTIADIAKTSAGGTPNKSSKEFYEGGTIPWLMSGEVGSRDITNAKNCITVAGLAGSSAKLFPSGSVLVAMYGATAGEAGILRFEAATNQAVCAILPSKNHIPEYLYYYLLHAKQELVALAVGNAQPNISQAKIKTTLVPLPPLEEQKRIVAVLDQAFTALDRARAHAEANLAAARMVFKRIASSLFQDVSSAGAPVKVVSEIAERRKGSIRTGPFGSQLKHGEFVDAGVCVLGIDNAVKNTFRWGKPRHITEAKYSKLIRYRVFPGDVIITIMGTCGRCAIVPEDIPVSINTKHLCCITLNKAECLPEYLHKYFLLSPKAIGYLEAQSKGSVMDGLNMGLIKELPVDLPSVEQQQEICRHIDRVEKQAQELEQLYSERLADIADLRQSLLQKAFSGELT